MIWLLFGIHIVICVVVGILIHRGKIRTQSFAAVVFVPFFGCGMLLVEQIRIKRVRTGTREIGLDSMKIEDAIYQRIETDQDDETKDVVPLEEAILVNDAATRRKLMMSVLQGDPAEHIDLLREASLSGDTELTHYATTTMMEVQSGYEQRIRELEHKHRRRPADTRVTRKLRRELTQYTGSGLLSGSVLEIYRNKLAGILEELVQQEPENRRYYLEQIENDLKRGKLEQAGDALKQAAQKWDEDEALYRLQVSYYASIHRGDLIQALLQKIRDDEVYLSSEGRKWYAYWSDAGRVADNR